MRACTCAARSAVTALEQVGEFAPRGRVHEFDVDGIGPPDIVLPRNGVLEGR